MRKPRVRKAKRADVRPAQFAHEIERLRKKAEERTPLHETHLVCKAWRDGQITTLEKNDRLVQEILRVRQMAFESFINDILYGRGTEQPVGLIGTSPVASAYRTVPARKAAQ